MLLSSHEPYTNTNNKTFIPSVPKHVNSLPIIWNFLKQKTCKSHMILDPENKQAAPQKRFFKNWMLLIQKAPLTMLVFFWKYQKMFSHKSYKICQHKVQTPPEGLWVSWLSIGFCLKDLQTERHKSDISYLNSARPLNIPIHSRALLAVILSQLADL